MSKMENNTVNKAGSTGVELNLNDGTQRYQVTKKDLKKTADEIAKLEERHIVIDEELRHGTGTS